MAIKAVRIYKDLGNGTAIETELAQLADGKVIKAPVSMPGRVFKKTDIPPVCPIVSPSNQNSMFTSVDNQTIKLSEDATGNVRQFRSETADMAGMYQTVNIGISNAEATGGPDVVLLGNGNGVLSLTAQYGGLNPGTLRSGVTFSGTWGTSGQTILAAITKANPIDVHELNIQGFDTSGNPDSSFLSDGFLKLARGTFNGDAAKVVTVPLAFLTKPGDFNTWIKFMKDFRFTLDGMSALVVNMPIGKAITLTMRISAAAQTYGMNKV